MSRLWGNMRRRKALLLAAKSCVSMSMSPQQGYAAAAVLLLQRYGGIFAVELRRHLRHKLAPLVAHVALVVGHARMQIELACFGRQRLPRAGTAEETDVRGRGESQRAVHVCGYGDGQIRQSEERAALSAAARVEMGGAYRHPQQQDMVSVSVSIPLVDWGVRKGKYNMARNNLNVVKISSRQSEISIEEEVIMTVNDFNIQQSLVQSASRALDLADMAYEETRQRYIIGQADINSLTLSLNRQQEAQRNYISALQSYWLNYYKIRRLTLFDFASGFSLSDKFDWNVSDM